LSPTDKENSLSYIDFSSVGNSIKKDSSAFKNIQKYSKITSSNVSKNIDLNNQIFDKINNLYVDTYKSNSMMYYYGTDRQHTHSSVNSYLPSFSSLVDDSSFKRFLSYTMNLDSNMTSSLVNNNQGLVNVGKNEIMDNLSLKGALNLNKLHGGLNENKFKAA
jgi:hypothetical protein